MVQSFLILAWVCVLCIFKLSAFNSRTVARRRNLARGLCPCSVREAGGQRTGRKKNSSVSTSGNRFYRLSYTNRIEDLGDDSRPQNVRASALPRIELNDYEVSAIADVLLDTANFFVRRVFGVARCDTSPPPLSQGA